MKRWIMVTLFALNTSTMCFIGNLPAVELEADLELTTGYRVDDLDWNIAGTTANVLSELTWSDLEIYQVKIGGEGVINRVLHLRGSLGFGWILDGDNQDSDFEGDNRALEVSRSNNSTDDDHVFDVTAGFGYQFNLLSGRCRLIPLVGYAYSEQNLRITDGFQTISVPGKGFPDVGPIANLDSTYDTKWYGPWVGVDLWLRASEKIAFSVGFEYHWADYEAEAFWNLRTDPNFEHEADGTGFLITVGGDYRFADPWSLGLEINYQDWSTDAGIDREFRANGTIVETRLNEVNWDSFAIMLKLTYHFRYEYFFPL